MKRREFITLLGSAAAWPLAARAQQLDRMRLIGVLMGFAESDPTAQSWLAAFRDALTKAGWKEGNNLRIEIRWAAADPDRIRTFAKELVDLRPDAIFGQTTPVTSALAHATRTVPIVFVYVADPIGFEFAASFAHPGGNITGFSFVESTMGGKWLELLKEIAPRTERVALLFNPETAPQSKFFIPSIQAAGLSHAVEVSAAPVHAADEVEGIIVAQARSPGGSLIVMPDVFTDTNRQLIIELTARYGVPAIYARPVFAESGGLIAYGVDLMNQFRQAAGYIHRILNGANPGDLPIERPTKFQLSINLKTAKSLGLTVPLIMQMTADDVIE
jgi:putative ABC transport system substrate-binding protein